MDSTRFRMPKKSEM